MTCALSVREVAKPWGRKALPPPFDKECPENIGELSFVPPAILNQLMVKYIFTSETLSIQVHPSDEQTLVAGLGRRGKDECWLVIDAEPGASLGIGFCEAIDAETLRAAALDGSIEQRLAWHPVSRGDYFYIPANTVHAIGAGVSLIEVQQNSDITYRLFDYGRPRELHLDQGMAVAQRLPYNLNYHQRTVGKGRVRFIDGPFFRLDRIDDASSEDLVEAYSDGPLLVLPLTAEVLIAGEPIAPGGCAVSLSLSDVSIAPNGLALIVQPKHASPKSKAESTYR